MKEPKKPFINIKARRLQFDLTQKELAEKIGMCSTVLSHYEKGLRQMSVDTAGKLSETLRMPYFFFLPAPKDFFNFSFDDIFARPLLDQIEIYVSWALKHGHMPFYFSDEILKPEYSLVYFDWEKHEKRR